MPIPSRKREDHVGLRFRRHALAGRDSRLSQGKEVGRQAPPPRREPRELAAPLKAAERKPVQEERGRPLAALDVRDRAEARLEKAARALERGRVQVAGRAAVGCGQPARMRAACGGERCPCAEEISSAHAHARLSESQWNIEGRARSPEGATAGLEKIALEALRVRA